jgi:hypothetical protein
MQVQDWIHILQNLPPHLEVYLWVDDAHAFPVCGESDIEEFENEDEQKEHVFMLRPCCHTDDVPISTTTHPN